MKISSDIYLLSASDVTAVLKGRESDVIGVVRRAYEKHAKGESVLPHSVFVRMPGPNGNRGIALPAQLGGEAPLLGMKWITSFPANIHCGFNRASAIIVLNDVTTGRPTAIIEGSTISAVRTAASAALASSVLATKEQTTCCGMIGCGRINYEIARFLRSRYAELASLRLYDIDLVRAEGFRLRCQRTWPDCKINICQNIQHLLNGVGLVSIATTASTPHLSSLYAAQSDAVILHISLRDLTANIILACDNVVDDIDHVCRENTSIHLAEKQKGSRNFIRCTLGDVLLGRADARRSFGEALVFSPFGLGILDLAVASFVFDQAISNGECNLVKSFFEQFSANDSEGIERESRRN